MLLLLLLVAGVTNTLAQTVTIRGNNGSMVAAMASGQQEDLGYKSGGFATWQHEQLSMVLTTSDETNLTPNMQLDNPANNLYVADNKMQICKGDGAGYVSLSLPKGYRFTSYTIVFSRPNTVTKGEGQGNTITFNQNTNRSSVFGETGSDFGNYITQGTVAQGSGTATITRTEGAGGSMSNVLYFKLGPYTDRYDQYPLELITLESAEFRFTAEENYSPVGPTTNVSNVSAVDVPFYTSKVDYGRIQSTTYFGHSRITYTSANVTDLQGYFKLYEAESLKDGTGIDGVQGKVAETKTGTISSAGNYFKLGRTGQEQVYFLETPDYVEVSDGTQVPVGYRIVGAKFEAANQVGKRIFFITYDVEGEDWWGNPTTTTYYLGTNGRFTNTNNPARWEIDQDGYISSNGYYLYWNNNNASTQRTKPVGYGEFEIYNGKIRMRDYPSYYVRCLAQSSGWGGTTYYGRISNTDGEDASYTKIDESGLVSAGDFTLKVYTKDGKSEFASETINSENPSATIDLTNLNNDAVKFGVSGVGLVRATLTLQALDPYLNSMDVVCQDEDKHVTITQPFTAADFSVNGGTFHFYLPEDLEGKKVNISFANLSSEYMDETYDGGKEECNSRINFVKSAHYNEFGASNNSLYNDRDEAADAKKDRLSVEWAGTAKFKFNNADEVGTSGGTLAEYPFSLEAYGREGGEFQKIQFTVEENDQNMVRYVFTTDETRYNIAPTTAIQHRAYAFYEMDVHVQSKTYTPNVKFTKVYDETLYRELNEDGTYGGTKKNAFYGVEVTAKDADGKAGYSSSATIFKIIDAAVNGTTESGDVTETVDGTTKKIGTYEGKTRDLTSSKQLIYLDFSKLAGVYQITDEEHSDMPAYSATNAANCLIYLPKGSSASNNNVAAMSEDGKTFTAVADIKLTDMQPFYSLYDVQVLPTRQAIYQRGNTKDSYGKAQHFSIILPYQLKVENGVHTNIDGSTFTVRSMQTDKALTLQEGSTYAYMPSLADVSVTVPNMPYFIEVPSDMDESNLAITQNGTLIKATKSIPADTEAGTPAVTYNSSNYTFTGPSSSGSVADGTAAGSYNFTPTGTFAGIEVPKAQNIFYFGNNEFVNSADYNYQNGKIKVAPFRMYYANGSGANGAKLASFGLIFGEGIGDDPTGISSLNSNPDLMVVPGNGVITVTSTKEQNVRVNSVSGVLVNNAKLQAGETQTINVPAGVYVINGVKIIVK